ncbi:MerR family DNA-binding transcriptional regulator [Streptomyces sp. WAC05858]|uniref:MerR family DNA-binding transcriptional regulator n=1 Tax=Streptomyces TaxID=1883 RepID=UPI0037DC6AEB
MRIGELAKATGATTRALRFYEERGLLSSARAVNGYRVYDERAIQRVANIRICWTPGSRWRTSSTSAPAWTATCRAAAPPRRC